MSIYYGTRPFPIGSINSFFGDTIVLNSERLDSLKCGKEFDLKKKPGRENLRMSRASVAVSAGRQFSLDVSIHRYYIIYEGRHILLVQIL